MVCVYACFGKNVPRSLSFFFFGRYDENDVTGGVAICRRFGYQKLCFLDTFRTIFDAK